MFIKKKHIEVGSIVKNDDAIHIPAGTFTKGTLLKVTAIGPRGYDVEDQDGNRAWECGFMFTLVDDAIPWK